MKRFGPSHVLLAFGILTLGGAWAGRQQYNLSRQQATLSAARHDLAQLCHSTAEASEQLARLRNQLAAERADRDAARAAMVTRTKADAERVPESLEPPAPDGHPEWNPRSPYVWLRKDSLARLGVFALHSDGSLTEEACSLLAISPTDRKAIGSEFKTTLAQWHAAEAGAAARSDRHLSQMRPAGGRPVTVVVSPQPELAGPLRAQLENMLQRTLGEQRAEVFKRFAESAMDNEFGRRSTDSGEPPAKIYSIQRDGDRFNLATQTADGSLNTITEDWRPNIPAHLQPFFAEALDTH